MFSWYASAYHWTPRNRSRGSWKTVEYPLPTYLPTSQHHAYLHWLPDWWETSKQCSLELPPLPLLLTNLIPGYGDPSTIEQYFSKEYRPVSLTSLSCKLFEHIWFRHIMSHLENHNVLLSFQHGFRAQYSCDSQLIITVEDLAKNLDINKLKTDVNGLAKSVWYGSSSTIILEIRILWNTW